MPTNFTGRLNSNYIFAALYNMIISQQVFVDNINGTFGDLVNQAKTDGGLYGDTKLFYSTDVLGSEPWGADAEAGNLLDIDRPTPPDQQAITLNVFRQIRVTVDYYLTKQAWVNEGAMSSFTGATLGWITDTKRVYDSTIYNTFIGTHTTNIGKQMLSWDIEAAKPAESIANHLANLIVDLRRPTRDYNDNGNLRSCSYSEIKVIWNSKYVNEIRKIDLPTIFHKDGLVDKFEDEILPQEYFGDVQEQITNTNNDGTFRSLVEKDYNVLSNGTKLKRTDSRYKKSFHVFPGDLIPSHAALGSAGFKSENIPAKTSYKVNAKIICKIVTKLPPYMSAFEVGTTFYNPRSLTENHYNTFGHNTLQHIFDKPFITVKAN